jgi:hypothetical protein
MKQHFLSLVKKEKLVLSTQVEINSGYLFGKYFSFYINIVNMKAANNKLTNQCVLNIADAKAIYKRLKDVQVNMISRLMILCPMEYLQLHNGGTYMFKTGESQSNFF